MNQANQQRTLPRPARILGYCGLIPFIFLPVAINFDVLSYSLGGHYFILYSAVILSFLGGVHWLNALQEQHDDKQIYVAMLPSIVAWLSMILLPPPWALSVLTLSHASVLLYDRNTLLVPASWVKDYMALRIQLTSVVAIMHFLMLVLD
ncbi:MAG: DUF3429 domain-containing protein [Glaciecola sp.]|jgi:hypothetical protein